MVEKLSGVHRCVARVACLPLLALTTLLVAGGCTEAVPPVPVASISLSPAADSVEVGVDSHGFIATLRDGAGKTINGRRVTWSSANDGIATVDDAGKVHGVALGQTLITAEVDGRSAQAAVKVIIRLAQIVLTPDSLDVPLTTSKQIIPNLIGPNGEAITGRTITWSSANSAVATVGGTGLVSAVTAGNTTVTATAGSKSAVAKVHVSSEPVAAVRMNPLGPVQVVRLGQTFQLSAQCLNGAGAVMPGLAIDWTTGNPSVATVASGLVTAVALGTATITAACGNKSTSILIQVTTVPVVSVVINQASPQNMQVGQQQQLTLTARDSANNVLTMQNRFINWTSDNTLIASVGASSGILSAIAQGGTGVQVAVDGVTSPQVVVNVTNVPVATVQLTAPVNPPNVKVGSSMQLTPILRDANGNVLSTNGRNIQWFSLDPSLASVSVNGLVSGLSAGGPVTIQAVCEGQVGSIQINVVP